MGEQQCLDCLGNGSNPIEHAGYGIVHEECPTCEGTGAILRTGPYRLQDGTWSDGVDRSERITNREFSSRWEVFRYEISTDDQQWGAGKQGSDNHFRTFRGAIAYADRMARTSQGDA